MADLVSDLMTLRCIQLCVISSKLLTGTTNCKALIVEEVAYLTNHEDIMALIVTTVAATLDGA